MKKSEVCVVHLVRAHNGIEPLRKFLSSYARYNAGIDHDFLYLLKGFPGEKVDNHYAGHLEEVSHQKMFLGDWGYDITAYFRATRQFQDYRFFCFLNSFSEILADDWLLKLYRAGTSSNAGVAGATGSYQGFHPDWKSIRDREKFSMRAGWKQKLLAVPLVEELNESINRFLSPVFPNPHIRTNGFLIHRDAMLALHPQTTPTKRLSYGFESGWNNMTRQIIGMNKAAFIVGKDGTAYDVCDWSRSNTFWQNDQQNLLIADKQTRRYEMADSRARRVFRRYAWGKDELNS